jgi:hypothetical protein
MESGGPPSAAVTGTAGGAVRGLVRACSSVPVPTRPRAFKAAQTNTPCPIWRKRHDQPKTRQTCASTTGHSASPGSARPAAGATPPRGSAAPRRHWTTARPAAAAPARAACARVGLPLRASIPRLLYCNERAGRRHHLPRQWECRANLEPSDTPQTCAPASPARPAGSARATLATSRPGSAVRRHPCQTARPAALAAARPACAKVGGGGRSHGRGAASPHYGSRAAAFICPACKQVHTLAATPSLKPREHNPSSPTRQSNSHPFPNPSPTPFPAPNPRPPRRHVRRRHLPPARGMRERSHVQPRHRGVRRCTQTRRHALQHRRLPGRHLHRWGGGRRSAAAPPPARAVRAGRPPAPPQATALHATHTHTTAARAAITAGRTGPRHNRTPNRRRRRRRPSRQSKARCGCWYPSPGSPLRVTLTRAPPLRARWPGTPAATEADTSTGCQVGGAGGGWEVGQVAGRLGGGLAT